MALCGKPCSEVICLKVCLATWAYAGIDVRLHRIFNRQNHRTSNIRGNYELNITNYKLQEGLWLHYSMAGLLKNIPIHLPYNKSYLQQFIRNGKAPALQFGTVYFKFQGIIF